LQIALDVFSKLGERLDKSIVPLADLLNTQV